MTRRVMSSRAPAPPTEIKMNVGDVALYYDRVCTITRIGSLDRIVWVEVTDEGGRTRTFSGFVGGSVEELPTGEYEVLDSLVKATAQPEDPYECAARKAELWFARPQVGDIFFKPDIYYYLRIIELSADGSIRAQLSTASKINMENCHTEVSFTSLEAFQREYQFKTLPGYSLLAYSSLRSDEVSRTEIPDCIGEWK